MHTNIGEEKKIKEEEIEAVIQIKLYLFFFGRLYFPFKTGTINHKIMVFYDAYS